MLHPDCFSFTLTHGPTHYIVLKARPLLFWELATHEMWVKHCPKPAQSESTPRVFPEIERLLGPFLPPLCKDGIRRTSRQKAVQLSCLNLASWEVSVLSGSPPGTVNAGRKGLPFNRENGNLQLTRRAGLSQRETDSPVIPLPAAEDFTPLDSFSDWCCSQNILEREQNKKFCFCQKQAWWAPEIALEQGSPVLCQPQRRNLTPPFQWKGRTVYSPAQWLFMPKWSNPHSDRRAFI